MRIFISEGNSINVDPYNIYWMDDGKIQYRQIGVDHRDNILYVGNEDVKCVFNRIMEELKNERDSYIYWSSVGDEKHGNYSKDVKYVEKITGLSLYDAKEWVKVGNKKPKLKARYVPYEEGCVKFNHSFREDAQLFWVERLGIVEESVLEQIHDWVWYEDGLSVYDLKPLMYIVTHSGKIYAQSKSYTFSLDGKGEAINLNEGVENEEELSNLVGMYKYYGDALTNYASFVRGFNLASEMWKKRMGECVNKFNPSLGGN